MRSRRTERLRRAVGWSLPAVLVALAPKCLLCVAAYAGLGAALGVGGQELCGASSGAIHHQETQVLTRTAIRSPKRKRAREVER
jgi:hypothetical protein